MRLPIFMLVLSVSAAAQATESGFGSQPGLAANNAVQERLASEAETLKAERQALKAEFERLRQKYAEFERRSKEFESRWREVHPCIGDCYLPGERPDGFRQAK